VTEQRRRGARKAIVYYRGLPHLLDLAACRQGLVRCQVQGKFASMDGLAEAARCSRSTASRFFAGRPTSLAITLRVLEQLGLGFDEVARPCALDDGEEAT
jgi:hypothetical protein